MMNWKDNIHRWRSLSPAQQQQLSLARSPVQVWQSIAFEGEAVSLSWLQAEHLRLLTPEVTSTSAKAG